MQYQIKETEGFDANGFTWKNFSLPNQETRPQQPVWLLTTQPGSANIFTKVAADLLKKSVPISIGMKDEAIKIFNNFPVQPIESAANLTAQPKWLLCCAENDDPIILNQVINTKKNHPNCRIALIEDYPGVLTNLIKSLNNSSVVPDIIFTTSFVTRENYQELFLSLPFKEKPPLIIPMGQATIDEIREEKTSQVRSRTREKLQISQGKVITYIGIPENDFPGLNSHTLESVISSLDSITQKRAAGPITFIYRPHYRENNELIIPLSLINISNKQLNNLRIIIYSKDGQVSFDDRHGIKNDTRDTTREVCAASDMVITINSTVGTVAAIANGRQNLDPSLISIPLHILPSDQEQTARAESSGIILPLKYNASLICRQKQDLETIIEKALYDPETGLSLIPGSQKLAKLFRIKGSSQIRPYMWMRWIEKNSSS